MSIVEREFRKSADVEAGVPARPEADRSATTLGGKGGEPEELRVLWPLSPVVARMQADEDDPMRCAWDDRKNPMLFSQLRNIRREIGTLLDPSRTRTRALLIVVTSAVPGEGKSFISAGLARAFAAGQDRQVVLVDADLPKRHLTGVLGTAEQPGMIECLADSKPIAEVLCRTDHAALSFLPAGNWRSDAPDLLCGPRLDRLFEAFRHSDGRRVFVVDTAPILAFGETAYLAERADLVVMVARADQTPRAATEEALRKLAANRPLAMVLNGQQEGMLDKHYGYGDTYHDYLPK